MENQKGFLWSEGECSHADDIHWSICHSPDGDTVPDAALPRMPMVPVAPETLNKYYHSTRCFHHKKWSLLSVNHSRQLGLLDLFDPQKGNNALIWRENAFGVRICRRLMPASAGRFFVCKLFTTRPGGKTMEHTCVSSEHVACEVVHSVRDWLQEAQCKPVCSWLPEKRQYAEEGAVDRLNDPFMTPARLWSASDGSTVAPESRMTTNHSFDSGASTARSSRQSTNGSNSSTPASAFWQGSRDSKGSMQT